MDTAKILRLRSLRSLRSEWRGFGSVGKRKTGICAAGGGRQSKYPEGGWGVSFFLQFPFYHRFSQKSSQHFPNLLKGWCLWKSWKYSFYDKKYGKIQNKKLKTGFLNSLWKSIDAILAKLMRVLFLLNLRHSEWSDKVLRTTNGRPYNRSNPFSASSWVEGVSPESKDLLAKQKFATFDSGKILRLRNQRLLPSEWQGFADDQWLPLQGVGVGAYDDPFSIFLVFRDVQGAVPYIWCCDFP